MRKEGLFIDREHIFNQGAPGEDAEPFSLVIEEGKGFLVAVDIENFPLVFASGGNGKFHLQLRGVMCMVGDLKRRFFTAGA